MTDLDELAKRINHRRQLEQLEEKPVVPFDPSEGMELEELRKYVRFLYSRLEEEQKAGAEMRELVSELRRELKEANAQRKKDSEALSSIMASMERLMQEHADSQKTIARLARQLAETTEQLEVFKKHRFGKSSQKQSKNAKASQEPDSNRESDRQDFDGTAYSGRYPFTNSGDIRSVRW